MPRVAVGLEADLGIAAIGERDALAGGSPGRQRTALGARPTLACKAARSDLAAAGARRARRQGHPAVHVGIAARERRYLRKRGEALRRVCPRKIRSPCSCRSAWISGGAIQMAPPDRPPISARPRARPCFPATPWRAALPGAIPPPCSCPRRCAGALGRGRMIRDRRLPTGSVAPNWSTSAPVKHAASPLRGAFSRRL